MVMQTPDEVEENPEPLFFDDRIGPLEDAIVEAALGYEQAWREFAHRAQSEWPPADIMNNKVHAHHELLGAIRAYRNLIEDEA